MVKFVGYPDIENAQQQGFIDKIKEQGYGNIPYVVFEKIHGGNSQVAYDIASGEFTYGKRSGFLGEGENFYNLEEAVSPYKDSIVRVAKWLISDLGEFGQCVESVVVFGEICGGSYPHKDVVKDKHASRVQKAVFYSPCNVWFAFDIAYRLRGIDRLFFLSGNKFIHYCAVAGIPMVPLVAVVNSLDIALSVPNDQESKVYKTFGLPKLENNIMEGVVIRPAFVDVWIGYHRVIIKNKNTAFSEKKQAKKNEAPVEVPEAVKKACEEVLQYITVNRVHNVISHVGEVTEKDIGKLIMETSKDVLVDYRKEYDSLDKLEKKEEKMVTKFMNGEVAKVVRDVVLFGK